MGMFVPLPAPRTPPGQDSVQPQAILESRATAFKLHRRLTIA
jgi:hypothetical protein